MYIFNLCLFADYFSKIRKAEWSTLPLKESLSALFIDLGIDNILSESLCVINIKRLDKEIIRSGGEFRLLKITGDLKILNPEFMSKNGVKYRFLSAFFDGYHLNISFEVGDENEIVIKETCSVWELRRFMGVDIPRPLQVMGRV